MITYEVPFIRPAFPPVDAIAADMAEIVSSNWYTNFGPKEQQFRRAVADYVGGGVDAATFNNATIALVAALSAVLEGAEESTHVLMPSFTFAAGAHAVRSTRREPLLIDIDERTLQPSLTAAEAALRSGRYRVGAILMCNSFGIGAENIAGWERLAATFGLPLVIDSAAGFGSLYPDGTTVGTRGDCEVFSFHATKPFAIGEGGAVVSRNHALTARMRSFSNFGFGDGGAVRAGLNGKLQEINAAIGIRQLESFDKAVAERRRILVRYRAVIDSTKGAQVVPHADRSSVCFCSVSVAEPEERDAVLEDLRRSGIEARVYYAPPIHLQPAFRDAASFGGLEVTESVSNGMLALPVYPGLSDAAIDTVGEIFAHNISRSKA